MVRIDKNNSTIRDSHFPLPKGKGWRWVRLGEVCEKVSKGTTPTTYGYSFVSEGIPFLRAEDITGGPVDFSSVEFHITKETHDFLKRSKLRPGDLLITIAGTLGRVGYIPEDAPESNCNQAVAFARIDSRKADVEFLCYILQVPEIASSFIGSKAGGTIQNLNLAQVRSIEIPLPPLPEQKRIAAKIQELMQEVERARAACEKQLEAAKALPAAYLRQVFESEEAKKWERKRLGEVCEINPGRPKNFTRSPETPTTFVPMTAVDERTGTIAKPEIVPYSKVSKGYTYFEEGDVLFAKITPCMQNGKHVIAKNLIDGIGFGTTEFHVLRPSGDVLPEWVHFFIRQPHFLKEATLYFTGAVGQQRVPEEFLSNYIIPIPSLPVQERIIAELKEKMSRADKLRKSIEKQLEAINALPQAILRKAFRGEL